MKKGVSMRERIVELKRAQKMTTETISKISQVPVGTIKNILSGESDNTTLSTAKAIAKAFHVTLDYLIGESDDPQPVIELADNERRILSFYRSFNNEGQEKVYSYIQDIVSSGKYKKDYSVESHKEIS